MAASSQSRGLPRGSMMAVGLGERDAAPYLRDLTKGTAVIACVNSPSSVTISGDESAIEEIAGRLADQGGGIFHRRLAVDTAYHSHHMRAVADDYASRLSGLDMMADTAAMDDGSVTFISSVTGGVKCQDFGLQYWVDNLVSPVHFCDAVQALTRYHVAHQQDHHVFFVEIGPHPSLAGPVRQSVAASSPTATGSLDFDYEGILKRKTNAVASALNLAGRLFERNMAFDTQAVLSLTAGSDEAQVCLNMPAYSWDHTVKHWHESRFSREYRFRKDPHHDLLGVRLVGSTARDPRWRQFLSITTLPWLAHHVLDGLAVFPGSGYVCMVAEAVMQLARERHLDHDTSLVLTTLHFRHVSFLQALVVPEPPKRVEVQLGFQRRPDGGALSFAFSITSFSDGEWHENCNGLIDGILAGGLQGKAESLETATAQVTAGRTPSGHETIVSTNDFYQSLEKVGTSYGPTFAAVQSLSVNADENMAYGTVKIPDTQSMMPGQHQQPHLIHPTTLDALQHVSLPIIEKSLGPGSVMPVCIDELLMTAKLDEMPRAPDSELRVESRLVSSHFRKARAELSVTACDTPVLSFTGVEVRNVSASSGLADDEAAGKTRDMAFAVEWQPDVEHLRSEDLVMTPTFDEIVRHICYKTASLSVLVLEDGIGNSSLHACFLDAIEAHKGSLAVCHRVSEIDELEGQNLDLGDGLDVVLITHPKWFDGAATLLKPSGILIMAGGSTDGSSVDSLRACISTSESQPTIEVQMAFYDKHLGLPIITLRPADTNVEQQQPQPKETQILCHSFPGRLTSFAERMITGLRKRCCDFRNHISLRPFNHDAVVNASTKTDICTVVIDDGSTPILSSPESFDAAITLLGTSSKVIWISQDNNPATYQITGAARVAHAENDGIQVTTIHVAPEMNDYNRLVQLVKLCISGTNPCRRGPGQQQVSKNQTQEREYRVCGDGRILVPRLRHHEAVNRALFARDDEEMRRVGDLARPVKFLLRRVGDPDSAQACFQECADHVDSEPLSPDDIELETRYMAVTRSYRTSPLSSYVGTVTRVGTSVNKFAPGDRVIALVSQSQAGSSHPRTPQNHVSRLPEFHAGSRRLSDSTVTALLLDTMAACHAIQNVGRLSQGHTLLVHGASTPTGRAAVAFARAKGARVTVAATDSAQAHDLHTQLGVSTTDILVVRRSLQHPSPRQLFPEKIDIILQTTEDAVPSEVLDHLKPFGCVVVMAASSSKADAAIAVASGLASRLPPNAALHNCDILSLLAGRPDMVEQLLKQAVDVVGLMAIDGLKVPVRDITSTREALLHLDTGVFDRLVIEATPDAIIPVQVKRRDLGNLGLEHGTFVVAGGLGDLGWRYIVLLARRGAKSIITLSRRAPNDEDHRDRREQLDAIQPGCRLHCFQCDIASDEAVIEILTSIGDLHLPPVRGVLQCATILQDRTLGSITYDDFCAVTRIKMDGTLALLRAFDTPHLDFFIMLSSIAGVTGSSGQANYSAGNVVQDMISHAGNDRASSCSFTSLNFGWVEDAQLNNETRRNAARRAGMIPIAPEQLLNFFNYALDAALRKERLPQIVIGIDNVSLAASVAENGTVRSPMFCHVRSGGVKETGESEAELTSRPSRVTFSEMAATGDGDAIVGFIAGKVATKLAQMISVDTARIDTRNTSVLAVGVDSLVAVELRNWIMREFDAPLQTSELLSDQTIYAIAEKVRSRSRALLAHDAETDIDAKIKDGEAENQPIRGSAAAQSLPACAAPLLPDTIPTKSSSTIVNKDPTTPSANLKTVPFPSLQETLDQLKDSRRPFETPNEHRLTSEAVQDMMQGIGPTLQQRLQDQDADQVADALERQIYLERRDPLHEYSLFSNVHPLNASPPHTQALRAAVLTIAAVDFARRLDLGEVPPDTLHGDVLSDHGRGWLFYANRRPGVGVDRVERFSPNETVAVLCRGHVFELRLPGAHSDGGGGGAGLSLAGVHEAYRNIIRSSEARIEALCAMTADNRDSWALAREELEQHEDNKTTLNMIDRAAFVVCVDDESPQTPGERHEQFLIDGRNRAFANRWLDKPVQFAVTANGVSGSIYEHAKLDALDAFCLEKCLAQAVLAEHESTSTGGNPYPIREHVFSAPPSALQHMDAIRRRCLASEAFAGVDHRTVEVPGLSIDFLRAQQARPNATAHLVALLAIYLTDGGTVRPCWEIANLAVFHRGRIDWVQTMTEPARGFLEAAAGKAHGEESDVRRLFDAATETHARKMAGAARGRGFVRHLYALRGMVKGLEPESRGSKSDAVVMPGLFQSRAWDFTRRDGEGQDFKIAFMPGEGDEEEDGGEGRRLLWDEGGFLVGGERGVLVGCGFQGGCMRFVVTARPGYADAVCKSLGAAAHVVVSVLSGSGSGSSATQTV